MDVVRLNLISRLTFRAFLAGNLGRSFLASGRLSKCNKQHRKTEGNVDDPFSSLSGRFLQRCKKTWS